jgi:hypothetical protein
MAEEPYVPHPIDTSDIKLDELKPLLEELASNAHEVWAQKRIEDGWTLGPQRDDAKRKHPCLVPYDQLPDSEKEYDRALVNQTLKTTIALGYRVVNLETRRPKELPKDDSPHDDMDDSADILEFSKKVEAGRNEYEPLLNALMLSQEVIFPQFQEADHDAKKYRKEYQNTSQAAVWFGVAAIFLGLYETVYPYWSPEWVEYLEFSFALLCLASILVGVLSKPKEHWLLARYRAEKLRLLKFKTIMDTQHWCVNSGETKRAGDGQSDDMRARVTARVAKLRAMVYQDVEERTVEGVVPDVSDIQCSENNSESLREIIKYYCGKRIRAQMSYLANAEKNDGAGAHLLVTIVFFITFGCILLHSGLDLLKYPGIGVLITAAVIGPAFVAGIKTYIASRESARNALRHRATLRSLQALDEEMVKTENLSEKFRIAQACELVLEFDASEFMRLLREVEWYG